MKSKLGQLMIIGISGSALTEEEKSFIVSNDIGGVVLFGRNLIEPRQVWELCESLRSLNPQLSAPLFIGIDMEGGRVHRLKPPFTQWPPLKRLGDIDNPTVSFHFAYGMALELRAIGINLDFAPCVDIFNNPANTVIGDRSIGNNPSLVERHASSLVRGYIKGGIVCCAKHFPGHGHTLADSHYELPIEDLDLKRLHSVELVPFKKVIRSKTDLIMTSHILFRRIDPQYPVTLSSRFLQDLLRKELRFKGLIVSDDLDMKALVANFDRNQIPLLALQAGVDILLYCNEPEMPLQALNSIHATYMDDREFRSQIDEKIHRIIKFKSDRLQGAFPLPYEEALKIIGCQEHRLFAHDVALGIEPKKLLLERDSSQ
ncbi:MAG: beta-N-acetylhexosaminidase [Bdellovibrionaceae bacterium]|nr:beta-N-acetylhexosaminidase [Pseudobdellovibrionaceae bacterium]